jgi:hemolysin activation/secretion protein
VSFTENHDAIFKIPAAPRRSVAAPSSGPWRLSLALLLAAVRWLSGPPVLAAVPDTMFIQEYRVEGVHMLPRERVEETVYPFLGPGRTSDDVEHARSALEQAYSDAGYQTVAVQIPPQQVTGGIVRLVVLERQVGRLRVRGARYSAPSAIKAMAPSLAEGKVINFNQVAGDVVALNQEPDRQVTPSLHAGASPDTVDVDLDVKESAPLHASIELNNRHGPSTTALRVNASVTATNLWQEGQAANFSFQGSPQSPGEVKVFSAYYLTHFRGPDGLGLMLLGTKQDSNVSTLGDVAVAGRGESVGARALVSLPGGDGFVQSLNGGIDFKHFNQTIHLATPAPDGSTSVVTPITYFPLTAAYSATWLAKRVTTELNTSLTLHLRGLGSSSAEFNLNRYQADSSFVVLRADLSQTRELPGGYQLFGKVQGQLADQPLLSQEQQTGGGWGTVRGYLEAEQAGDSGAFGSLELRSPSLLKPTPAAAREWRVYVFAEAGRLTVIDPLPGETAHFDFASFGIGSRVGFADHFNGTLNVSVPQTLQQQTKPGDLQLTFRAALDY